MNSKKYHKLDKIVLSEQQLKSVSAWVEAQNFKSLDIPLQECLVIITGITNKLLSVSLSSGIYFCMDGNNLSISQYYIDEANTLSEMFSAKIGDRFFTEQAMDIIIKDIIIKDDSIKSLNKEEINKLANASILAVFDIFQYMTNKKSNIIKKKVTKTMNIRKKRAKNSNKRTNTVKIHSNRYIFEDNLNLTNKPSTRDYDRRTESWSVRGHWRYYKDSGKRVWIDGYTKGRGDIEGKEYRI